MIFVLELPTAGEPHVWFAYDEDDLLRKVEAGAHAVPWAQGDVRVFWSESEATAAFERSEDALWQGTGWRARWALREQLVALEVLADDL
jgi:hypothetical protein